ncbi:MAG: glucosaminidase domain-containing protein [Bacteroidetes bacterium]|nr:glucosaminidase domain-containing protein [Bacteroidota bacterium]
MKKILSLLLSMLFCFIDIFAQQADYNAIVAQYVQKFKDIAVKEMELFHVPASITLAQGILESNAGRSPLAVEANNHFGIKCHKEWAGMKFYKDDETKNECFRKYESPLESFKDHSIFLTSRDRYKNLFQLEITDYKGWANGLKSAGYATNPAYPQLLIKTIETFSLDRFDKVEEAVLADDRLDAVNPDMLAWLSKISIIERAAGNRSVYENNHLRMIIARQDDNLYVISRDFNVTVSKLLSYNDLQFATALKPGQIVYLEQKRRKGCVKKHKVLKDETLYDISQRYGIKLKTLSKRNDLPEGSKPKYGTILRLR